MSQGGVVNIPSNVSESFVANIGSAAPSGGVLNIVGGTGITTSASGNTVTITNTQTSTLTFQTAGGNAVSSAGAITFTGAGGLNFSGAGSTVTGTLSVIPNASLANSAVTINVSNGLTGGGSVSLGGSVNIVGPGASTPTSGNLVLIQSRTASSSASLTFTNSFAGYDNLYLVHYGVIADTNDTSLTLNFSTDGGATYDTSANYYQRGFSAGVGIGLSPQNVDGLTFATLNTAIGDGAPNANASGFSYIYSVNSNTVDKNIVSCGIANSATYSVLRSDIGVVYDVVAPVNALRLQMGAGNIATGTFKLYGIVN